MVKSKKNKQVTLSKVNKKACFWEKEEDSISSEKLFREIWKYICVFNSKHEKFSSEGLFWGVSKGMHPVDKARTLNI